MTAATKTSFHEDEGALSGPTKDLHRALTSLGEELEAVDWYQQRAEATDDPELRAVLAHNRDEEIEHAMMLLEWIRRRSPAFDRNIRSYLLKDGPIAGLEASKRANGATALDADADDAGSAGAPAASGGVSLHIGSLRKT